MGYRSSRSFHVYVLTVSMSALYLKMNAICARPAVTMQKYCSNLTLFNAKYVPHWMQPARQIYLQMQSKLFITHANSIGTRI